MSQHGYGPLAEVDNAETVGFELGAGASSIAQRRGRRMLTVMPQYKEIWNSRLELREKVNRYYALVLSAGSWGLHLVGLSAIDFKHLEYIHARCVQRIFRVKAAYISGISNREVLRRAGTSNFGAVVRKQQMKLLGHILRKDETRPDRRAVFAAGTERQREMRGFRRRRGRPRST